MRKSLTLSKSALIRYEINPGNRFMMTLKKKDSSSALNKESSKVLSKVLSEVFSKAFAGLLLTCCKVVLRMNRSANWISMDELDAIKQEQCETINTP